MKSIAKTVINKQLDQAKNIEVTGDKLPLPKETLFEYLKRMDLLRAKAKAVK